MALARLTPADFVPAQGQDVPTRFPGRTMKLAEIARLGLSGFEGGARGFILRAPAGTGSASHCDFSFRPLLPDEQH